MPEVDIQEGCCRQEENPSAPALWFMRLPIPVRTIYRIPSAVLAKPRARKRTVGLDTSMEKGGCRQMRVPQECWPNGFSNRGTPKPSSAANANVKAMQLTWADVKKSEGKRKWDREQIFM